MCLSTQPLPPSATQFAPCPRPSRLSRIQEPSHPRCNSPHWLPLPRSHLASVPWSTANCPANTFRDSPSRVRQRTSRSPIPLGRGGSGVVAQELDYRGHVLQGRLG